MALLFLQISLVLWYTILYIVFQAHAVHYHVISKHLSSLYPCHLSWNIAQANE